MHLLLTSDGFEAKKLSAFFFFDKILFPFLFSMNIFSVTFSTGTFYTLTVIFVGITKLWFTLLKGTPLTLNGPVTNNNPESSCFKNTTLFPLNLPDNKMRIYPGLIFFLRVVFLWARQRFLFNGQGASSALYHLDIL